MEEMRGVGTAVPLFHFIYPCRAAAVSTPGRNGWNWYYGDPTGHLFFLK